MALGCGEILADWLSKGKGVVIVDLRLPIADFGMRILNLLLLPV
jgi:hypothetical protein